MNESNSCPCASGLSLNARCKPFIDGTAKAPTHLVTVVGRAFQGLVCSRSIAGEKRVKGTDPFNWEKRVKGTDPFNSLIGPL